MTSNGDVHSDERLFTYGTVPTLSYGFQVTFLNLGLGDRAFPAIKLRVDLNSTLLLEMSTQLLEVESCLQWLVNGAGDDGRRPLVRLRCSTHISRFRTPDYIDLVWAAGRQRP